LKAKSNSKNDEGIIRIPGYRLGRLLGAGSMASVYIGIQEKLQRPVAIKVLHTEIMEEELVKDRFVREARLTASLEHPYIIPILDVGTTKDGRCYIVMQLASGLSLKHLLKKEGCLTPRQALRIIQRVAEALMYAHKKGLVHRDVKSANILIHKETGDPILADFGIAKVEDDDSIVTREGIVLGSPSYIAPEQARGEYGYKGDMYGLGICFYEMLVGKVPFSGTDLLDLITKHVKEPLPKLDAGLSIFQPLLEAMCKKNPEERVDFKELLLYISELSHRVEFWDKGGSTEYQDLSSDSSTDSIRMLAGELKKSKDEQVRV